MKIINGLLYLLNKLDFDSYLEGNVDEKLNYRRRILIDDFEDFNSVKIKNILNFVDGFVITLTADRLDFGNVIFYK